MALENDLIVIDQYKTEVHVTDEETGETWIAFIIDKIKNEVIFFPREDDYFVDKVTFKGFSKIPKEIVSANGYLLASLGYYFGKYFTDIDVESLTISKTSVPSIVTIGGKCAITLNFDDVLLLKKRLTQIVSESQFSRHNEVLGFLSAIMPEHFETIERGARRKKELVVTNLDDSIIKLLAPQDVKMIETFYQNMLKQKYKNEAKKLELITETKLKVDGLAIDEAIDTFSKNLEKDASESEWGEFIKKYLYLVESRYIQIIDELNLALGSWRKVDFGLVDTLNFLDIFEIKKPTTKILSASRDRNNYFWATDSVKAIMQAEKYLYFAERKATILTEDIRREYGLNIKIIRPRAVLLIGHSEQLNDDQKLEDFEILRKSLKNIEIILYDELLERLMNQKRKSTHM